MPSTNAAKLKAQIASLQAERATHATAIAEIDKVFAKFGIKLGRAPKRGRPAKKRGRKPGRPAKKRGRKPGRPKKARRGRKPGRPKGSGKKGTVAKPGRPKAAKQTKKSLKASKSPTTKRFTIPGPEAVQHMIKMGGKRGAKSSSIAKSWKRQGRKGNVHAILGQLVKAKKVKRQKIKGQQGSVFRVA